MDRAIAVLKKQTHDRGQASPGQLKALKLIRDEAKKIVADFLRQDPGAALAVSTSEANAYEFQSGDVVERELEKSTAEVDRLGKPSFAFAFYMDRRKEERERGVAISGNTKEAYTENLHFITIDVPGHSDFIKNMIAGASQADVALIMVSCEVDFATAIAKGNHKPGDRKQLEELKAEFEQLTELKKKAAADKYDKTVTDLIRLLFDTSLLTCGFNPDDPTQFAGRIHRIIKLGFSIDDDAAGEEAAVESFNVLVAAKEKQINALTQDNEDRIARSGDDAVKLSEMKEDLEDTKESLAEDKQFFAELEKSCATKDDEWDERCKTSTEELLTFADTIKILNDDDALELFKKTLPAPALIQTRR